MKTNIFFLGALMALIASFSVFAGSRKERLYIYNWSYYTPASVIEKFEKEYGVKVYYDEFASNEEMYAKLRSGGSGYDLVFPSADYVSIMKRDMLEKLDKSKIPNLKNIDPGLLAKAMYDPDMEYSVPYFYGATGIAVNTAKVPDFEKSCSIFSRRDLRGRMTMLDDMRQVLGDALQTLGYSVNSRNQAEVRAARDLVNAEWKPNIVKFDSETFGKGYANGDFWVVQAYAEVVFEEIADDPQLMRDTVFFIPEGSSSYIDAMCILKDAPNKDLAHAFIDFIHRPEIYAEFCDEFGLPATVNIPARRHKKGPSWYEIAALEGTELQDDLGPALEYYNDAWFNSIRIGN